MVLWLLKSPSRIKGVGSCCNMLLISLLFMAPWGGIYMEQILIVLCKVKLDSYCMELSVEVDFALSYAVPNKDWDTTQSSMTGIADEIVTLVFFFIVISSSVLRNVSWKQTMAGCCWVINKSSSLLLALILRQFHWIILWFIVRP